MNYMNDRTNMIAVLIIISALVVAVIGMLFVAPSVLKSNSATLMKKNNNTDISSIPRG
jgi:hypothetical protein